MADKNVYKTPESDLISSEIPSSFNSESISPAKLRFAGWLSVFYAIISIPIFLLSMGSEATGSESLKAVGLATQVVSTIIWIYLLFAFMNFMQTRFNLLSLGKYVYLMVGLQIVLVGWLFFHTPRLDAPEISTLTIAYFSLIVPYGIVVALFGKKLFSVKVPYPYLRAFTWTIFISGLCIASIVLILVAAIVGIVSDVLLALVFFNGRKELLKVNSISV